MEKPICSDPASPGIDAGPAAGETTAKEGNGDAGEGAASGSGGFGRACIGRLLTKEHREELRKVLCLTGPLVSREKNGELLSSASRLLSDVFVQFAQPWISAQMFGWRFSKELHNQGAF